MQHTCSMRPEILTGYAPWSRTISMSYQSAHAKLSTPKPSIDAASIEAQMSLAAHSKLQTQNPNPSTLNSHDSNPQPSPRNS